MSVLLPAIVPVAFIILIGFIAARARQGRDPLCRSRSLWIVKPLPVF